QHYPLSLHDALPILQTIHAPENLWTLEALNENWLPAQKPLQDFLQWLDYTLLKMWNVNKRVFLEMVKLGTGIYKAGWLYEKRPRSEEHTSELQSRGQ